MPAVAVKISAELSELAKAAAAQADRSLAGQVEHWAKLGRAIETKLPAPAAHALKQSGGDLRQVQDGTLLEAIHTALDQLGQLSRDELRARIGIDSQTRFEPHPSKQGFFVRITPDGKRTDGKLTDGQFLAEEA